MCLTLCSIVFAGIFSGLIAGKYKTDKCSHGNRPLSADNAHQLCPQNIHCHHFHALYFISYFEKCAEYAKKKKACMIL